jgi:ATP-dependent RNA helicase RhlB
MSEHHLSDKTFESFNLPEPLLLGVREAGFQYCTPIQAESLPIALEGRDIAGQAQTGTGKTAAFLLAAFTQLLKTPPAPDRKPTSPRVVMLAPTRELAVQIAKDAAQLGKHLNLKQVVVYGGTGYESQRKELEQGVDVLIGTPGRAIDYLKQHVYDLDHVAVLVLDEADRMFDLGFIRDIRFILRRMGDPSKRLNMLFSATLSYRVTELAYEHMNNPQFVHIEPDKRTADKVTQVLYHTAMDEKIPLLIGLLRHMDPHRSLLFVNTKDMAEKLTDWLSANGFESAVLSGDVPQKMRLKLLQDFTEGRLALMVATDVAARGLHIPDVSHVFNFDLPQNAEDYVHRIGRTARAGSSGDAVSFACEKYVFSLSEIEEYVGHKIPTAKVEPNLLATDLQQPKRREREYDEGRDRGRGGRHPGRRDDRGPRGRDRGPDRGRPHDRDRPPRHETPAPTDAMPKETHKPSLPRELPRKAPPRPLARRGSDKPAIG